MLAILQDFSGLAVERLELFFLVLVRMSVAVYLLPILSLREVPGIVKAGLSALLAIVVFPSLPPVAILVDGGVPFFFSLVLEQFMVGSIIGFGASFCLHFIHIGGYLMARDIGVQNQSTVDPVTDDPSDDLAVLIMLVLSTVFLYSGGHLQLIRILMESFRLVPLGQLQWDTQSFATLFLGMFTQAFLTGVRLGAPVMGTVFVAGICLAMMARVMPQMNIWIVGIPVKIAVGFLTLWVVFPMSVSLMDSNFQSVQESLLLLLKAGGPHGG